MIEVVGWSGLEPATNGLKGTGKSRQNPRKTGFSHTFVGQFRAAELEIEREHVAHLVTLRPTPLSDAQLADARSAWRRLDGKSIRSNRTRSPRR